MGNGKSTNRYHIPYVLARQEKYEIKTIVGRKTDDWPRLEKVLYTPDLCTLLRDDEIDLVVVCTPNDTHYQLARQILEAGKNCLVEKPFCMTAEEARRLFELADKRSLCVSAYQNRRFDSDFLTVKEVIRSGKLGELLEVETHFDYNRPEVPGSSTEYNVSQSFVYTNASHSIDQMIDCFGTPDAVRSDARQLLGKGRMNDYYDVDLYYGALKVSVKGSYFRVKMRPAFVVYGKKGVFIKETRDRQEMDLKRSYFPYEHMDFGLDRLTDYGTLLCLNDEGIYVQEKIPSIRGDYGCVYDEIYDTIVRGSTPTVTKEQIVLQIELLEGMVKKLE